MQNQENDPAKVAENAVARAAQGDFVKKIVEKLQAAENILIVLSKTPTVDELAAVIGLALFLDGIQKHATAIYSGEVPAALAFLRPEETFEKDTTSLQDFIISLAKEKADHLRYKLEGDFVKVYITPYRTQITEADLSYSWGDYNVDFVVAINVKSAGDLDEALKNYGQVIRDASVVDITTGEPGRFGEIEWANQAASSVCEMMTELIFEMQGKDAKLDAEVATALLTGIVAATERFSNTRTNPETMGLASRLMAMGADQQLITANISGNDLAAQPEPEPIDPVVAARLAAQGQAVEAIKSGADGVAGAMNPAAMAAPGVGAMGPEPANVAIPPMTDANGVPISDQGARAVAATMPLDTNSAVVMPTMGSDYQAPAPQAAVAVGAATGASAGTMPPKLPPVQGMPFGTGVGSAEGSLAETKEMATSAPVMPSRPAQGMKLTPPEAKEEPDYAGMMEKAMGDPAPENAPKQPEMSTGPVQVPGNNAEGTFAIPGAMPPTSDAELMKAEQIKKAAATTVLPPPPAPEVSGVMPPKLPPVQ